MAENITTTTQISNRTAAFAVAKLLMRALPLLVFEKFGQTYPIPNNSTTIAKFRRFEALDSTVNYLVEGVTPSAKQLSVSDVTAQLRQIGDLIVISDVVKDTQEDPTLDQAVEVLGEQAAQMVEKMRYGVLTAGTNVFLANGSARTDVNTILTLNMIRKVIRSLKQQNCRPITSIVKSTPAYGTVAVTPAFVAVCHPDVEADLRGISGFLDVKNYGNTAPFEGELGAVEGVRFIVSTTVSSFPDGGGNKGSMVSTSGVKADVYPILVFAKDAYGIVPLKGKDALSIRVINPDTIDKSDPLGQRGYVGWKSMQTAVILNQAWMARMEVAVTAL